MVLQSPAVRIKSHQFSLTLTSREVVFSPLKDGSKPLAYGFERIEGVERTTNEFGEPAMGIFALSSGGKSGRIVVTFEGVENAQAERDRVLATFESMLGGGSGGPGAAPVSPSPPRPAAPVPVPPQQSSFREAPPPYRPPPPPPQYAPPAPSYQEPVRQYAPPPQPYEAPYAGRGYDAYSPDGGLGSGTSADYPLTLKEKMVGFLKYPSETFQETAGDSLGGGLKYLLIMAGLYVVVTVLVAALLAKMLAPDVGTFGALLSVPADLMIIIVELLIFLVLGVLVYGLLGFVILKAGRWDLYADEALVSTCHAATPLGTFGLIPFFGTFAAPLWMVALQYKGFYEGHEVDSRWAAAAAVVPAVVFGLLYYLLILKGGLVA